MKCYVFDGWAAAADTWLRCSFCRDRIFDYLEQLDGEPERTLAAESDGVVLVGFSMGGSTALRMSLAYREKVRGLVLVSATARMMEARDEGWSGMSVRRRAALKFGTVAQHGADPSPLFADANLDRGLDYLARTDLRAELRAEFGTNRPASFPVWIFQSARDGIVRPQNADFLKSVFPLANVTMVPGGEHTLPPRIPDLIDGAVRRCRLRP